VGSPDGLREALLARPDQFVQALTEKLMIFALGRSLRYQDMPSVRAIVRRAALEGNTFESIIRGIADSAAFRMKEVGTTVPNQQTAKQQMADQQMPSTKTVSTTPDPRR
jgi:hypothetical protein